MMKFCGGCRTNKSRDEYSLNKTTVDGFQGWCRACMATAKRRQRRILKRRRHAI